MDTLLKEFVDGGILEIEVILGGEDAHTRVVLVSVLTVTLDIPVGKGDTGCKQEHHGDPEHVPDHRRNNALLHVA